MAFSAFLFWMGTYYVQPYSPITKFSNDENVKQRYEKVIQYMRFLSNKSRGNFNNSIQ